MPKGQIYLVTLTKIWHRKPKPSRVLFEVNKIIDISLKRYRRNWEAGVYDTDQVRENGGYKVIRKISFKKINGQKRTEQKYWTIIYNKLVKAATGLRKWNVESAHAPKNIPQVVHVKDDVKDYAPINLEMGDHFSHIFGLEPQIRRIMRSLKLAKQTNLQKRQHIVLFGLPGSGKTELLRAVGRMLGEEKVNYIEFDATSTTQAGAINVFLSSSFIAPILLVEEIEKTHPNDQRWMLGLLDQRAEIRQVNFRVGQRGKNIRVVCIATCNNIELFKSIQSGALASRFRSCKCPRPPKDILYKILEREVMQIPNGKKEWIKPTLEFAEELKITDPRDIIDVLLSGQDDLLTGLAQADYRATV